MGAAELDCLCLFLKVDQIPWVDRLSDVIDTLKCELACSRWMTVGITELLVSCLRDWGCIFGNTCDHQLLREVSGPCG